MSENIYKLTKNGETVIPATTTDAVVFPGIKSTLTNVINDYNVSVLFPTSGVGGTDSFTLEGAIAVLNSKLVEPEKKPGLKLIFKDNLRKTIRTMKFLGGNNFSDLSLWSETESINIIDGGRADTLYGGVNVINCGGANAYV